MERDARFCPFTSEFKFSNSQLPFTCSRVPMETPDVVVVGGGSQSELTATVYQWDDFFFNPPYCLPSSWGLMPQSVSAGELGLGSPVSWI